MYRLIKGFFVVLVATFLSATPLAFAADGSQLFQANCTTCHAGGTNRVNGAKTLSKDDLGKWEMASLDKITYQVTNGKLAMPSFKGRLQPDEIKAVAQYVLDQAEAGW
ncbi:MAG: c-type cytochrome [Cyanobacteria bacterium P01_H01_bin.15]